MEFRNLRNVEGFSLSLSLFGDNVVIYIIIIIHGSNLMELRKTYGDQFLKAHGIKLGFMSAFVKASAYALTSQPAVNAVIDGNEIVYRDYVDISVAVATPKVIVVEEFFGGFFE